MKMSSNQILQLLLTEMDHQVFKIIVPKWTDVDQMLVGNTYILQFFHNILFCLLYSRYLLATKMSYEVGTPSWLTNHPKCHST
jgi:hypothetical protein